MIIHIMFFLIADVGCGDSCTKHDGVLVRDFLRGAVLDRALNARDGCKKDLTYSEINPARFLTCVAVPYRC